MALPNYEKMQNKIDALQELIIYQDVPIAVTTSNGFGYKSQNYTIPTGYTLLSASIVGNGYVSQVMTSIIALSSTYVAVNYYTTSAQNITITVRLIFKKNNN